MLIPLSLFLTGGTGFLGAFLLSDLLEEPEASVYCLVRASNTEKGHQRLQNNLQKHSLWKEEYFHRIIPVLGDLSKPLLGLSENEFGKLANKIDVIYHNGAWVNWVLPYSVLKSTNVGSAQEVLRLAVHTRLKPVHYISTNGIFLCAGFNESNTIFEDTPLCDSRGINLGYSQSKWVAEKIFLIGRSRGIPVSIYRPGVLEGDVKVGHFNKDDFLCLMIKGCIQDGIAPEIYYPTQITPVDFVSKSVAYLSKKNECVGKTFHLFGPNQLYWNNLVEWINNYGYNVKLLSYKDWCERLEERIAEDRNHPLFALKSFFKMNPKEAIGIPRFDCEKTFQFLEKGSIICPSIDSKLLKKYFSYFIQSGFLDPPKLRKKDLLERVDINLNHANVI